MTTSPLPEAWQKPEPPPPPPPVVLPVLNWNDPAELAAFYSGNSSSFFEHWRKILLANLRETLRTKYALAGTKVSEAKLEDESRCHEAHLDFMETHLEGRVLWEREAAKQGRGG